VTRCDIAQEYIRKVFKDNTISLVLVHYPKISFLATLHILVIDVPVSFCVHRKLFEGGVSLGMSDIVSKCTHVRSHGGFFHLLCFS